MSEQILKAKIKELFHKSYRFNDAMINNLASADDIDIDAICQRALVLETNEDKTVVGHDPEWARSLLLSIKTLKTLEIIAEREARDKRHVNKIGQKPFGRSDILD